MALRANVRLLRNKQIDRVLQFIQKRHRVKTKWAATLPKVPPSGLALQNFDASYANQLGDLWPSVRVALLSEQKYGALVNNFSRGGDDVDVVGYLRSLGCRDFIADALEEQAAEGEEGSGRPPPDVVIAAAAGGEEGSGSPPPDVLVPGAEEGSGSPAPDVLVPGAEEGSGSPPPDVLVPGGTRPAKPSVSPNVRCFVFPRGDASRFKPARPDGEGRLGYYLMDAASLLPVLALGVREGDSVLDLCAAPGGKTLALLQTRAIRFLWANDSSDSRLSRLLRTLHSCLPPELLADDRFCVSCFDGRRWEEAGDNAFDKVLVDVPCTTDRRSLAEDDNNVFSRSRTKERRELPLSQTQLLLTGLQAARPGGGEVVYSTCTLSALQNELVVQRALEVAREELGVTAEVVDLRPLADLFGGTFRLDVGAMGVTVLPHLTANFGPAYFCKLRRLG